MTDLQRPHGMPRVAFEAYQIGSERAEINIAARDDLRLVQIIGNAAASKGFHHAELGESGIVRIAGEEYAACYDLSVRGLKWAQIAVWLEELCRVGFTPFYRYKGSFRNNLHIHCNYAGVPMKEPLQRQVLDYFQQLDGLVGHKKIDDDLYPSPELVAIPKAMFALSNGANPHVVSAPTKRTPVTQSYALYLGSQTKPVLWMPLADGVALAPVRAYGTALGFDVEWNKVTGGVSFNGRDLPIAHTNIAGVMHSPIRALAKFSGFKLRLDGQKVVLSR